ncbi:MAG: ABC transporter permease [Candidatus Bathyarchaeota archaeon]|nr:ABC transporter permease [Candidatus Bathyarchaeota archaeon]
MASSALLERRFRAGLTIFMVIIGSSLIMAINGLSAGSENLITDQLGTLGSNLIIVRPYAAGGGFSIGMPEQKPKLVFNEQTVNTLKGIQGVSSVVPFYEGIVTIKSGGKEKTATLVGIENNMLTSVAPKLELLEGSFVTKTDQIGIVLGNNVAYGENDVLFARNGQTLSVEFSKVEQKGSFEELKTKRKSFQVKGILNELGNILIDNQVFVSLPAANSVLEKEGKYSGIYVISRDAQLNDMIVEEIKDIYGDKIGVTTPKAIIEVIKQILGAFNANVQAIGAISLIVGAIGIITTLYTSVLERTSEIGVLKAIGFSNSTILQLFLMESAIIGFAGGLGGVFTGIGLSYLLSKYNPFTRGLGLNPIFKIESIFFVIILTAVLSIIAGLYPAWKAASLSPIKALQKK